jgi:hypothetical protein
MRVKSMLAAIAGLAALTIPPAVASAQGYASVWRPGSGTQWWRSRMTEAEFKTQDLTHFNNGLRVRSLAIHDGRFAAVWQPGTGTQWIHWGLNGDQFKAQDLTYFRQGLRIQSLEVTGGRLAAVWRPGTGAQWVHWGMTEAEFKTQDLAYFNQGLRLQAFELDGGRFAGVWRPGTGTQWVHWGLTGAQIEAQDRTYFNQGLRLTQFATDGGRYAGVWRPGSGTQWWAYRRCHVDFRTDDALHFANGLRMSFIELMDEAGSPFRYPWKSGDSRGVGQGNNNAGGSHNGSQSFAFDFSLPAGTQIRAARAGTVEWLRENQSATFNPNQPVSASNQPFTPGSVQNWGNAVRIRHPGGLTSWYFHIQQNGVLVNQNAQVERGQPIAISGNTGRSSGPHLHFQVQADSTNWGQSVAISFQDCEVPTGGDSVTSSNANSNFP